MPVFKYSSLFGKSLDLPSWRLRGSHLEELLLKNMTRGAVSCLLWRKMLQVAVKRRVVGREGVSFNQDHTFCLLFLCGGKWAASIRDCAVDNRTRVKIL